MLHRCIGMLIQVGQVAADHATGTNISIGLLCVIEMQVTNLQLKVASLMKGKKR